MRWALDFTSTSQHQVIYVSNFIRFVNCLTYPTPNTVKVYWTRFCYKNSGNHHSIFPAIEQMIIFWLGVCKNSWTFFESWVNINSTKMKWKKSCAAFVIHFQTTVLRSPILKRNNYSIFTSFQWLSNLDSLLLIVMHCNVYETLQWKS